MLADWLIGAAALVGLLASEAPLRGVGIAAMADMVLTKAAPAMGKELARMTIKTQADEPAVVLKSG